MLFLGLFFQRGWALRPDNMYHFGPTEQKMDDGLPSAELASQVVEYARELEMIV